MTRRVGTSLAVAIVLAVAACGGPAGSPGESAVAGSLPTLAPPPIDLSAVPANVHVDKERATATWIGPAGGQLTATAADGTGYVLDIPEYAVFAPTPITMTPITSVDDLGLSGGLAGAVYLQPSGLSLAIPAILRIATTRTAPAGTRLVGFDVPDEGDTLDLVPAATSGSEISVAVFHFSGPGGAYGSPDDLAAVGTAANSSRLAGLLSTLLAYPVPWDGTTRGLTGLLIDIVWAAALRPELDGVSTDQTLLGATKDWRTFIFILNLYAQAGDVNAAFADGEQYPGGVRASHTADYLAGQILLGGQIARAIDGNEALCTASHDLDALANMWFWAGIGERYAPNERNWPEEARGCAEIVVATANLPTNLRAGGVDSLGLVFNLEFSDGTRVPGDFEATLHGNGFTFASTSAVDLTAGVASGHTLTESVSAQQGPPYALTASACWILNSLRRNLCGPAFNQTFGPGSSTPPGGPPGSGGPAGSGGSGTLPDISGTYLVSVVCNRAGEAGNLGAGSGTVTQSGATVSMIWSVTFAGAGQPSCGGSMVGNLPAGGSFTGHLELLPPDPRGAQGIDIVVDSGCPGTAGDLRLRYGMRSFFVPPCPISQAVAGGGVLYKALWQGP